MSCPHTESPLLSISLTQNSMYILFFFFFLPRVNLHGHTVIIQSSYFTLWFILGVTFYGFDAHQMCTDVHPPLLYHTENVHCLKNPLLYSSVPPCTQYQISKSGKDYTFLSKHHFHRIPQISIHCFHFYLVQNIILFFLRLFSLTHVFLSNVLGDFF